jgi:phosphoribosyl 1,2-cyclic phosphate phosphodiesterase
VLDALRRRFGYAFAGSGFYAPVVDGRIAEKELAVGNAHVQFVDQPHGDVTSLGLRFDETHRSAVYAIDFNAMTQDMTALYQGADVLVCDCLRREPHPTHAHLDAALGWATELGVGQLYLTLMNNSMVFETIARELPDWAAPAYDGLEIEL